MHLGRFKIFKLERNSFVVPLALNLISELTGFFLHFNTCSFQGIP